MRVRVAAALAAAIVGLGAWAVVRAQDGAREVPTMLEQVQTLLADGDTYAAAELVQREGSPADVATRYAAVVDGLYWKAKDAPGCVAVGRAGLLWCLTKSSETDAAEERRRLRAAAHEMSYNLGSYAWPGWAEEGVVLGPGETAAGLDAARLALRLARELEYPPGKLAHAHWLVGAQLLAADRHDAARAAFESSRDSARAAGSAETEWMAAGYVGIAELLAAPDDEDARERVAAARSELMRLGTDDARFFAAQLDDVLRYFESR